MKTDKFRLVARLIDVNFNRARESIRVIEDYTRFILNNEWLTTSLRNIRHKLAHLVGTIHQLSLLSARNVKDDIGQETVSQRATIPEIISANFKRLQESLRSLAEYLKPFPPPTSAELEKIRFEAYELEQRLVLQLESKRVLDKVRLYVLVTSNLCRRPVLEVVRDVIKGGAEAIQLREKELPDDKLIKLIRKIREITLKHGVLFIVNDRPDLAWLGQADGVHLGKGDLPIRQARQILGPGKIIGATTHHIKEAIEAQNDGVDYISVGPMFPSPTKEYLPPNGFSYLKEVARKISIPYVAIGGINQANLPTLIKRHQKLFKYPLKVAISSGIIAQSNPLAITRHIKKILNKHR